VTITTTEVASPASTCSDGCSCCTTPVNRSLPAPANERSLRRRAWALTALTIGWNSLEAVIAIVSGVIAGSIALVGFGLDSVVEVSSALIITWRLLQQTTDHHANERAERRAVRLIAVSFIGIALYVTYDAVMKLLGLGEPPERSLIGLGLVALSVIVMPTLAWAKRRVAAELGSVALRADAAQTNLCTYLSAVVLLGLAANALAGWWWMDPLAGLAVAALAVREGIEAWRSGDLCAC
jgi:divalent metal cation (Fe/Co/Zn/Cd) transporter